MWPCFCTMIGTGSVFVILWSCSYVEICLARTSNVNLQSSDAILVHGLLAVFYGGGKYVCVFGCYR